MGTLAAGDEPGTGAGRVGEPAAIRPDPPGGLSTAARGGCKVPWGRGRVIALHYPPGFTKGRSCLANLMAFYDGMTGWVGEGRAVDVVYLDLSKASDTVSHHILLGKLRRCGLEERSVRWVENWLKGRAQRVGISGAESGWRPGTSGVPRGQYWAQCCSTSSSVTWMKSESVPSTSLLMTQNWEQWWTHREAVLPSSVTWTGWRVGQRGT